MSLNSGTCSPLMPVVLGFLADRSKGRHRKERTVELSIHEAKARFAEAADAAARGERVIVTKHGRPFVELVPAHSASGMDFEKAAVVRREFGLDGLKVGLPPNFNDPTFSRHVLGITD